LEVAKIEKALTNHMDDVRVDELNNGGFNCKWQLAWVSCLVGSGGPGQFVVHSMGFKHSTRHLRSLGWASPPPVYLHRLVPLPIFV